MRRRFSRPVSRSSTAAYWPVRPMRRRTSLDWRRTSKPATLASSSAVSRVARMRTVVVLPAPFGPSSPKTVPAGTIRSTPFSAFLISLPPYRLRSPSAWIAMSTCAHPNSNSTDRGSTVQVGQRRVSRKKYRVHQQPQRRGGCHIDGADASSGLAGSKRLIEESDTAGSGGLGPGGTVRQTRLHAFRVRIVHDVREFSTGQRKC